MSDDIEDILNEIQLDPKYQLDGPGDFDEFDEDDLNSLMDHLGQQQQQHDEENDRHHHHKASHHQKGNSSHHHNPKSAAPRSSTQANLDELESLVAELASGDDDDHHHGHHQGQHHHHGGNGGGHHGHHGGSGGGHHHGGHNHQSVSLSDQPNFESSLDALLVDLGGIGERDSIPAPAPKRNTPQGHHHHTQVESGNFEDLLSDLTGGTPPSSGVRVKANSNAPEPVKPTPLAATSSNNKKQPINPRDSAAYVDDLENLMGELIGTSGGRSNSIVDRNPPAVLQNRSQGGLQRGPSRSGQLSTHQESDDGDLDSLISELSSTPQQPAARSANTVSKTYTGNAPKSQPQQHHQQHQQHQQHQASAPASRQPTQQAQPSRKPAPILEADDFASLMADLAPTAANKGRQSSMVPQNNKMSTNLNSSEVSELDNLMANLYPPNIHGKKPGGGNPQQKNNNQRVSVQADVNTDLDDMINNLQTGYGMVEQPSTAPQNNRNQKGGSTYISYNNPGEYNSNYNNNPQAAYNPNSSANRNNNNNNNYNQSNFNNQQPSYNQSNNNSHQGGGGFNQNSNAAASRTNTNQGNNNHNKQSRAAPASKDLMMMMDDLTTVDNYSMPPMNQHHQQHQQQPARKPEQPKLGKGMCAGCRKYIASTQKIQAMGREYHTDHFTCSTCEKVIGNANFFEKEGQPQCEACYQSHFCNRCANCGQPITSHCVSALNQSWHPDCWVCTKCRTPFNNASFYVKNNKAYCAVCSEDLNSQRCRGCNQPIRGTMINALGTTWHMDHFVCQSCHHPFPGGVFYEINGLPYCEQHYQSIR